MTDEDIMSDEVNAVVHKLEDAARTEVLRFILSDAREAGYRVTAKAETGRQTPCGIKIDTFIKKVLRCDGRVALHLDKGAGLDDVGLIIVYPTEPARGMIADYTTDLEEVVWRGILLATQLS